MSPSPSLLCVLSSINIQTLERMFAITGHGYGAVVINSTSRVHTIDKIKVERVEKNDTSRGNKPLQFT